MSMQLGDLLSELRENVLHDKSDQVAGASDYLWTDATLVRYIDEAHRRMARRGLMIRDSTTASVTQITTVNNQQFYPLDPSVLAVLSLQMVGDNQTLARAGYDAFNNYYTNVPDTMFFDPSQLSNMQPGKAVAWSTDQSVIADPNGSWSVINLTLYPVIATPYDNIVGNMRVIRLPIERFSTANLTAYPEIPEDHHLDMLDWAAYLALRSVDTDVAGANAAARAADFAARFEAHCQDARKEAMRKLFVPQQWGFGRNGWSWENG